MIFKTFILIATFTVFAAASPSLRSEGIADLQIARGPFAELRSDSCIREVYSCHWKTVPELHPPNAELSEEETTLSIISILEKIHQETSKCPAFSNAIKFDWFGILANVTGTATRLGSCYANLYSIQMDYEYGLKRFPTDHTWYIDILLNGWRAVGDCKDFVQTAAQLVEGVSKVMGVEAKLPKYDELIQLKGDAKTVLDYLNTVMNSYGCLHDAFWSAAMLGIDITTYLSFPNKVVTTRLTLGAIMNAYRANTECREAIKAIF